MVVLTAMSAAAQPQPGDVGLFADPAGTITTLNVTPGVATNLYLVIFDPPGGVFGWEASINGLAEIPGVTINSVALTAGAGPINVGSGLNFIVGTGSCVSGVLDVAQINFTAATDVSQDTAICIGPSSPSSTNPAVPDYLTCADAILPLGIAENGQGIYPNGCLILNPTNSGPVASETVGFGTLKARF
jgi:hypothetical protein